jgi:hypothetical protein
MNQKIIGYLKMNIDTKPGIIFSKLTGYTNGTD